MAEQDVLDKINDCIEKVDDCIEKVDEVKAQKHLWEYCRQCNGDGQVDVSDGAGGISTAPCGRCQGAGKIRMGELESA